MDQNRPKKDLKSYIKDRKAQMEAVGADAASGAGTGQMQSKEALRKAGIEAEIALYDDVELTQPLLSATNQSENPAIRQEQNTESAHAYDKIKMDEDFDFPDNDLLGMLC